MIPPSSETSGLNRGQVSGQDAAALRRTSTPHKITATAQQPSQTSSSTAASGTTGETWADILSSYIKMELMSFGLSTIPSATSDLQAGNGAGAFEGGMKGFTQSPSTRPSPGAPGVDYWLTQMLSDIERGQRGSSSGQTAASTSFDELTGMSSISPAEPSVVRSTTGASTDASSFAAAIQAASNQYGVPASLVQSVIEHESSYNPNAVSSAGALGLMQLMPATAHEMGVTNPFDAVQNIFGGTRYLASLVNQFHGDYRLAVAAYNAGPGAVMSHGGVPPYPETQNYVQKVLGTAGLDS